MPPPDASALLLAAGGDGVGPAALLSAPPRGAQLLVNAPEGVARLALEHRVRPSARLAAALLTSLRPDAAGGLPALLLRLAADGHGALEVVGPPGVAALVQAAAHFVKWVHPKVVVRELRGGGGVCYEDAAFVVAPVWARGGCAACALRAAAQPLPPPAAPKRPAQESDRAQPSKRRARGGGASSDEEADSDGDDSSSDDEPLPLISAADEPALPPRPNGGDAAPARPARPRTLGRPLNGCGGACACPPGGAPPAPAGGPNPVFVRPPPCDASAREGPPDELLGYAVLLRAGGEVSLFLDAASADVAASCATLRCSSAEAGSISAAAVPRQQHHPTAAVFHLTHDDVAASPAYAAAAAAATVSALHVAARGASDAIGFIAAARTTARLSALSPAVFPPPPALLAPQAAQGQPALRAGVAGRLLLRVLFRGSGDAPALDDSACPAPPDVAALAAEARASRPRLAECAAALHPSLRGAEAEPAAATDAMPPPPLPLPPPPPPGNASAAAALRAKLLAARAPAASPAALPAPAAPTAVASPPLQLPLLAAAAVPRFLAPPGDVIFLGTGCAEPSKHRGSAAVLLRVPGHGCCLLDCGEGAAGAIRRTLGAVAGAAALAALRCVLLSHQHADHMLGLPGVLCAAAAAAAAEAAAHRRTASPPPLVVGPPAAGAWLGALPRGSGACAPALLFLPLRAFAGAAPPPPPPAAAAALGALGLLRLSAVAVEHCADAHALVLHHSAGWSLAYSGDCRPSAALAAAAAGCSLLIHEATFEDSLADHARAKRHCTTSEALRVSATASARHTVLTHFSQRYPRAVALEPAAAPGVSLAFDGMRLRWDQLPHAAALVPLVAALLADAPEEGGDEGDDHGGDGREGGAEDAQGAAAAAEVL